MKLLPCSSGRLFASLTNVCVAAFAVLITAASPASGTTARVAARPGSCTTSVLDIWVYVPPGSGTAGGVYDDLEFTNLSSKPCTLAGYPGVSAANLLGHELGSAASRNPAHAAKLVTLQGSGSEFGLPPLLAGATATVVLKITDVGVYSSGSCAPTTAAGLRVYPPNQAASKLVPFPFGACSRTGPVFLQVEAVQKGIASDA